MWARGSPVYREQYSNRLLDLLPTCLPIRATGKTWWRKVGFAIHDHAIKERGWQGWYKHTATEAQEFGGEEKGGRGIGVSTPPLKIYESVGTMFVSLTSSTLHLLGCSGLQAYIRMLWSKCGVCWGYFVVVASIKGI